MKFSVWIHRVSNDSSLNIQSLWLSFHFSTRWSRLSILLVTLADFQTSAVMRTPPKLQLPDQSAPLILILMKVLVTWLNFFKVKYITRCLTLTTRNTARSKDVAKVLFLFKLFTWKSQNFFWQTRKPYHIFHILASIPALRGSIRSTPTFQSSQVLPPELGNNSLQPSRRQHYHHHHHQTKGIVIYDNSSSIFDATAVHEQGWLTVGNKWNPRAKFISGAHYFRKYAAFRR